MENRTCQLYLISPSVLEVKPFAKKLAQALHAAPNSRSEPFIGAFQLRLPEADDACLLAAARELKPICADYGVAFLLNNRPDLAAELDADGVHLEQKNLKIAEARALLGTERIVGVSCGDSRDRAMQAGDAGADYVSFGAFYGDSPVSPDMLRWWQELFVLPCVAIGGVTPENCAPLVATGADFIATIRAVWEHPQNPDAAIKAFHAAITQALQTV